MKILVHTFLILIGFRAFAQFEPQAGQKGSTAMFQDSSAFKAWAKSCKLYRGFMNIANTSEGLASIGDENAPLGKAGTNGVVSLGDAGIAILSFETPIANGEGFDFAVFENGFKEIGGSFDFLEFAFVEVSSDGEHFFRFPAEYTGGAASQIESFEPTDTRFYHNFAGKYTAGYGTPFDLEELKDIVGLDINNITQVKIVDVIGTIDPTFASKDSKGNIVNETYPTEFPSSGFDLDAVGVIHSADPTGIFASNQKTIFSVYPNPSHDFIEIKAFNYAISNLEMTDMSGLVLKNWTFAENTRMDISEIQAGSYLLKANTASGTFAQKLIVQ